MENNQPQNNSIENNILKAIESGQVKMHSKWYFVLKTTAFAAGITLAVLALLYIASFIVFVLRQSGAWFMPAFGPRGFGIFFTSLPWLLIALAVLFIVLVQILVRHYSFGYSKPLIYPAAFIILLALLGGFAVAELPLHRSLFLRARQHHLPFASGIYLRYGMPPKGNVTAGTVIQTQADGYIILTAEDETVTVIKNSDTRFPLGADFNTGDTIIVFGQADDGTIKALGIRKVGDGVFMPHQSGRMPMMRQPGFSPR